jgi:hypothetical protein
MCKERRRTRDLLLEYNTNIMPPRPRAAGLGMVYPWENAPVSSLIKQLFIIAAGSGFIGTESDFKNHFGAYLQNKEIIFDVFESFPDVGENNKLYFDLDEKILYYWDNDYIPVNAMLIANTTIDGGEA